MANLKYSASASVEITGITPASGPKPTVKDTATFSSGAVDVGDHVVETFVVNANTTATALGMGKISSGKAIWLEASAAIHLILTQDLGAGAVDNTYKIDKFAFLQAPFTAVKLANPSGTAVQVSVAILGDRPAVGAGAGIF